MRRLIHINCDVVRPGNWYNTVQLGVPACVRVCVHACGRTGGRI